MSGPRGSRLKSRAIPRQTGGTGTSIAIPAPPARETVRARAACRQTAIAEADAGRRLPASSHRYGLGPKAPHSNTASTTKPAAITNTAVFTSMLFTQNARHRMEK
jgi:hypothetical protein